MNDRSKTETWTSIDVGDDCIGAFLNRGEFGVEAYDADDVLLGVFADEDDAGNAIFDCWNKTCESLNEAPNTSTPPTQAQQDALHALGFTDDEILCLTPKERENFIRYRTPEQMQKVFDGSRAPSEPNRAQHTLKLPPTEWQAPTELPDLRRVGLIAIDSEEKDDGITADRGSAWPWHGGYICGLSVAYRAGSELRAHYFPIRHPDSENFDPEQVFRWLRDHIAAGVHFVTQNGLFDWGWLRTDAGITMPPSERLEEIGALATLVDENRFNYGLNPLCAWRGLPGKNETLLLEGCKALGLIPNGRKKFNPQAHIWQLPARFVEAYAKQDPISTLLLYENLNPILDQEGTRAAYRLEVDLLPMVHEMQRRGIRIDQSAAEQGRDYCLQKRDATLADLSEQLGSHVSMTEIASPIWKARTFDAHNIKYPRTKKGNPSFKAGKLGWMATHPHWLPQLIAIANKYHYAGSTFLQAHVLEHLIGDRIYGEINPHRSEEGGTKSFRFSYSNPPLQQMPSRDPELGPLIRRVFLPEEGEIWCMVDCSQQEFRFVAHHAFIRNLSGAAAVVERYRNDPDTDFHELASAMTALARKDAKGFNFAKIYGAGVKKIAEMIGKPLAEAQKINAQYDQKLPFISQLAQLCQYEANRSGYTRLYDGALRHWDRWAPRNYTKGTKGAGPCSLEEAQQRTRDPKHSWFNLGLQQVGIHTALNAQIQGDAARHTKLWMRAVWREGVVPLLQMHDGLELSVTTRKQGELVARLACEAVKLEVPMCADIKYGRSWGDATHSWEELDGAAPEHTPAASPETAKPPAATSPPEGQTPFVSLRDVVREFGAQLVHNKVICPFHDDHKPSCHIYHDHFFCFVCRANGNAITWLMEVENLTYPEAVETLESFEPRTHPPDDDGKTLRMALALWVQAQPIAGTLAEYYLVGRHIDVTQLPADVPLCFHPHCVFGAQQRHPCLLALLRDVETDAPAGILRTALTSDGKKIDRLSLGRWHAPRAIKLWPAGETLIVGEGVETVLSAATRMIHDGLPLRPAWATAGTARLATLPPIQGVKRLIVLADNDDAGCMAARRCGQTAANAGCTVQLLTPTNVKDFNDIVRGRAA